MKKSQLRHIIRESIKELMTEQQGTTCHYFSVCGATGVSGYAYPFYLNFYTAPNIGDKTIKSNDFYVAVGSPSLGSVVKVQGTNTQGNVLTCLTYIGRSQCTTGMGSYFTSAQGTPMSDCQTCTSPPPVNTLDPNMAPAEFTSVSPNPNPEVYDHNNFKGDDLAKIKRR